MFSQQEVSSGNLFHVASATKSEDGLVPRCGLLFPQQPRQLKTPNFIIGTARGSTPHLTPDLVATLPEYNAMQVSLGEVSTLQPAIEQYQQATQSAKPYHDMLVLPKNHCVALGLRNPTTDLIFYTKRYNPSQGQVEADAQFPYQLSAKIAATRSETGAVRLTPQEFLTKCKSFAPDLLLLGGQDSDVYETKSRAEKTMRRNLEWVDQLYLTLAQNAANSTSPLHTTRQYRKHSDLESPSAELSPNRPLLIAPIEGGSHVDKRTRNGGVISRKGTPLWQHTDAPRREDYPTDDEFNAAAKVYQDKITNDGYTVEVLVDGYHLGGLGSASTSAQRTEMIQASFNYINKNDHSAKVPTRLRMATITGEPFELLDLIQNGMDLISVTYPQTLTEEGLAMNIPITLDELRDVVKNKLVDSNGIHISTNDQLHKLNLINLRDERYIEDSSPIDPKCTCYACKHHSRSYINHLLNTHEMLAEVLLMLHNMHQYSLLFKNIRELIEIDILTQQEGQEGQEEPVESKFQKWTHLARQVYLPHADILHRNSRHRHYVHHDPSKAGNDEETAM